MPGGDAPPDPPSVGDVTGPSPFLCFLKKRFLANERDNIFGEGVRITRNHIKPQQTNGGLISSTCMHVRVTQRYRKERERERQDIRGCRALGGNLRKN